MKATGIVRRTMRLRESAPSLMTWKETKVLRWIEAGKQCEM